MANLQDLTGRTKVQLAAITDLTTKANKTYMEDNVHQYLVDLTAAMEADRRNPLDYGAKFDAVRGTDGAITSSDATFTSLGSTFTTADIGKSITVQGAGSGGAILKTTITFFNSATSVELNDNALTTVSSKSFAYGTDDKIAIQSAYDAVATGGILLLPFGKSYIGSTLVFNVDGAIVRGMGCSDDNTFNGVGGLTELIKGFNGDCIQLTGRSSVLENFDINCVADGSGDGISMESLRQVLRTMSVRNQKGDGVRIGKNSNNNNIWRIYDLRCLKNGGSGLHLNDSDGNPPDTNAGILVGYDARGNTGDGILLNSTADNQFYGVHCASNTGWGINLSTTNCHGNSFFFPYLEANTAGAGNIAAGAEQNFVLGSRTGTADGWVVSSVNDDNLILGRDNSFNDRYVWIGNVSFQNLTTDDDLNVGKPTGANAHKLTVNTGVGGIGESIIMNNPSANVASRGSELVWQNVTTKIGGIRMQGEGSASADSVMIFKTILSSSITTRMSLSKDGNLSLGQTGVASADALLELESTTKGLLLPRMTTAQRDAISSPTDGLVVYNSTTNKLNVRANGAWEAVTSA